MHVVYARLVSVVSQSHATQPNEAQASLLGPHGDVSHTSQKRGSGQSWADMQNVPPLTAQSWSMDWRQANAAKHTDGHGCPAGDGAVAMLKMSSCAWQRERCQRRATQPRSEACPTHRLDILRADDALLHVALRIDRGDECRRRRAPGRRIGDGLHHNDVGDLRVQAARTGDTRQKQQQRTAPGRRHRALAERGRCVNGSHMRGREAGPRGSREFKLQASPLLPGRAPRRRCRQRGASETASTCAPSRRGRPGAPWRPPACPS